MPIIGIDLGTTNSLVAYFTEDGPKIIPNSFGENLTPSVVSIGDDGEVLTGKIAAERKLTSPETTASVFKRSMGSKKEYHLGENVFLPEELSSIIIKKLKEDAEVFLGETIEEAVISTPAYFSDAQRRATKYAGELAGLKVERIVSEPTAAAVAYGLHETSKASKYLIFDLGGGTFDVSILEFTSGIMEVRAVAGDNFLGGEDFTEVLAEMFLKRHELEIGGLTRKEAAALIKSAETAKIAFSGSRNVTMRCILGGEQRSADFSLIEYEKECAPVLARIKAPVVRALSDASVSLSDVNSIVLVGGATKLPIVRTFVGKLFGRLPATAINPDEAVALGAAVQAAMKERNEFIKEMILTDVCPYTLGTDIAVMQSNGFFRSDNFLPIIERNTVIPVSRVERLYTLHDNQRSVKVEILQGESRKASDNIYLGELSIPMPPAPAGDEAVDVRYTYDINGILEVEVTAVSTGKAEKVIIEKNPGLMSEDEIRERLEDLKSLKIHPRDKDEYKYLIEKGERLYQEYTGDSRQHIAEVLREFEAVLDKQNNAEIEEKAEELKDYFGYLEQNDIF